MISGYYPECAKSNFLSATHHLLLIKYSFSYKMCCFRQRRRKTLQDISLRGILCVSVRLYVLMQLFAFLAFAKQRLLTSPPLWRNAGARTAIALQPSSSIYRVYGNAIGNSVPPIAQAMIAHAKSQETRCLCEMSLIFIFQRLVPSRG